MATRTRIWFTLSLILGGTFAAGVAHAADEDLRTLVRGGCLDEANCCFGKWKVSTARWKWVISRCTVDLSVRRPARDSVESGPGQPAPAGRHRQHA